MNTDGVELSPAIEMDGGVADKLARNRASAKNYRRRKKIEQLALAKAKATSKGAPPSTSTKSDYDDDFLLAIATNAEGDSAVESDASTRPKVMANAWEVNTPVWVLCGKQTAECKPYYWPGWVMSYDNSKGKYKVCFGYDNAVTYGFFAGRDANEMIRVRSANDWHTTLPHPPVKQPQSELSLKAVQLKRDAKRAAGTAATLRSTLAAAVATAAAAKVTLLSDEFAQTDATAAAATAAAEARVAADTKKAAAVAAAPPVMHVPKQSKAL
jgi:hypothetical protein